jgi:O-antigen/teichoic acid export membrane protein
MIKNSSYVFSANTLTAVLSMAQSVLAAKLLGVEAFGILGAVTQFASTLNRLTSFRMSELVVSYIGEYIAKEEDQKSAAVFKLAGLTEIVSSLIAFSLVLLLAPLGAEYLAKDPSMGSIFMLYGFSILANLIAESATGLLQIYDKFRTIALITVSQAVITLLLILGAFLIEGQLKEIVVAYLLGKAAWAGLIAYASLKVAREQWGSGWWRAPLSSISHRRRDLIRFALSTNLSGTINLITRDSDILWLNALSSPLQGGYYKVAKAFMNVLLVPITPLISTTYREVSREVAGRRWENVRYLLRSGTLISAIWTVPASLGLVFLGPFLILIYGEEFLQAYPVILVLLVGVIPVNLIYWNRSVLLPLGMPDYPMKVGFLAAGVQIAGMLLFVPRGGAIAMAAMMSAFFLVNTGGLLWKTIIELRHHERSSAGEIESEPIP